MTNPDKPACHQSTAPNMDRAARERQDITSYSAIPTTGRVADSQASLSALATSLTHTVATVRHNSQLQTSHRSTQLHDSTTAQTQRYPSRHNVVPPPLPPQSLPPQSAPSSQVRQTSLNKHTRRCVACLCDKSKPRCEGWPICKRHGLQPEIVDFSQIADILTSCTIIDWKAWYAMLYQRSDLMEIRRHIAQQTEAWRRDKHRVVLEIGFEDLLGQGIILDRLPVVMDCNLLEDEACSLGTTAVQPLRHPALFIPQLDQVVRDLIWGEKYVMSVDRYSQAEYELLLATQMFTGHLHFFTSLTTSCVWSTSYSDEEIRVIVATELVYTLGFRLQNLFMEIATLCRTISQVNFGKKHTAVMSYCLETLLHIARCCIRDCWRLPEHQEAQPLVGLYKNFLQRLEYALFQIGCYECVITRMNLPAGKGNVPPMLKLARDWNLRGTKSLPKYCNIIIARTDILCSWSCSFNHTGTSCHLDDCVTSITLERPGSYYLECRSGGSNEAIKLPSNFLKPDRSSLSTGQLWDQTIRCQDGIDDHGQETQSHSRALSHNALQSEQKTESAALAPTLLADSDSDSDNEDAEQEIMVLEAAAAEEDARVDALLVRYQSTQYGYAMYR